MSFSYKLLFFSLLTSNQLMANNLNEVPNNFEDAKKSLDRLYGPNLNCDKENSLLKKDERGLFIGDDPVAIGARKFLATLFQSCDALNNDSTLQIQNGQNNKVKITKLAGVSRRNGNTGPRRIINREKYIESHPTLKQLKIKKDAGLYPPSGRACADALNNPPVYGYGSKANINRKGEIELTTLGPGNSGKNGARIYDGVTPQAIDCSGLVSSILAMQGLKISPKHNDKAQIYSTSMFKNQANAKTSETCLNHARFRGMESLLTGDLINVGGSHIVVVDSIGEDPLGIKKHSRTKTCKDLSVNSLDFTYIHSGAMNGTNTAHIGPSRVHISYHNDTDKSLGGASPGTMFNNLVALAQKRCFEIVGRENFDESSSFGKSGNPNFGLLRHVANDDREKITTNMKNNCKMSKPVKVKGTECIDKSCI